MLSCYDGFRLRFCVASDGRIKDLPCSAAGIVDGDPGDLELDVVLDKVSGFYLRRDLHYMSCEKANGHVVTIDRAVPSDWERFYFSHFEHCSAKIIPPMESASRPGP